MGLKPDYQITANSNDITKMVRDRLISLRYTDESGLDSDVLEITLADNDPDNPIKIPNTGAELSLSIGYDGQIDHIGIFVCDELELSGWPGEMVIRAHAAVQDKTPAGKTSLRNQKSRDWPKDTTLGDMVKKIAKEHGLTAAVGSDLSSIKLPHTAQTDESNLHFLMRVARKFDAVVKPANGKLTVAKRGRFKTVSGNSMPTITLRPQEVSRWRMSVSKRETAGQVVAYWHAIKEAELHEATAGTGEPIMRLKMHYPTEEMALAAARSELDRRARQKATLSVTLPGRADMRAETQLIMSGFRSGVDASWVVTRAEHTLDDQNGYVCTLECEIPTK